MDLGKIEYRVREVTRYVVTRFHQSADCRSGGVDSKGEFDNAEIAFEVATALCKDEHSRLNLPVGDERITYPQHPNGTRDCDQCSKTTKTTGSL